MDINGLIALSLIALTAGILKSFILYQVTIRNSLTASFCVLCLFFISQNAVEFLGYVLYERNPIIAHRLVDLYFSSLYFIYPAIIVFTLSLAKSRFTFPCALILFGTAFLLCILHFSGFITEGYQWNGYALISIPGPLYLLFALWVLLGSVAGLLVPGVIKSRTTNVHSKKACSAAFWGLAPFCCVSLAVIAGKALGWSTSSALLFPLTTVWLLFYMAFHASNEILTFKIHVKVAFFLLLSLFRSKVTMAEFTARIEYLFITETLKETDGNQLLAGKILGIDQSTISRKKKRIEIRPKRKRKSELLFELNSEKKK